MNMDIEHGSFIPLMMSTAGGKVRDCKMFNSRLTEMIFSNRGSSYNINPAQIRNKNYISTDEIDRNLIIQQLHNILKLPTGKATKRRCIHQ